MAEPGTSILLVDDSDAKRYAAAEVLRRAGFSVIEAASGAEALSRAWEEPGLVILDVQLPDLDGFEVARRLKQTPAADVPVLHLSATFVRSEHRARGLESGAVSYLTYPLEPAVLVAQARALMRLSRAERERSRIVARERSARSQAESSRARFRVLSDLGGLLTATLRPAQMLQGALELLVPAQVEAAAILLHRGSGDRLAVRHADPAREEAFTAWVSQGSDALLMTSSLREETTGRPLAFDASQSLGPGVGATEPCARDLLLLPIRSPGELEGALLILRRAKAGPLSDEELLFLKEIASRLGTALAGAHAFAVAERERTRAEQAHAANDRFVAAISRELRAPLVSQLGWLDLLKGGGLDPQRTAQVIEVMESDAKLQLQLIDDLLDLSRSVIGKLEVTFQPVDLLDTLWLAADALREAAQAARVELVLPPRDGGAAWMVGDPTRLQQVITHLLSNAIRFSLPDSRVEVSLQAGKEQLVLAVRDHGVGIEADHLEAFFEPFWKETAGGRGGVGLGLPLVHSLVEGHHGSVRAHSEGPGKGTTVEVTLPRDLRHPVRDADRPAPDRSH